VTGRGRMPRTTPTVELRRVAPPTSRRPGRPDRRHRRSGVTFRAGGLYWQRSTTVRPPTGPRPVARLTPPFPATARGPLALLFRHLGPRAGMARLVAAGRSRGLAGRPLGPYPARRLRARPTRSRSPFERPPLPRGEAAGAALPPAPSSSEGPPLPGPSPTTGRGVPRAASGSSRAPPGSVAVGRLALPLSAAGGGVSLVPETGRGPRHDTDPRPPAGDRPGMMAVLRSRRRRGGRASLPGGAVSSLRRFLRRGYRRMAVTRAERGSPTTCR